MEEEKRVVGDIFMIMGGEITIAGVGEPTERAPLILPGEWPEELKKELVSMDIDFQKWLLDKEDDSLPLSLVEFRKYLATQTERKLEGLTIGYIFDILSNRLVFDGLDQILETDPFDEEKFREVLRSFTESLFKAAEVPLFQSMGVCDLGKEAEEKLAARYEEECDKFEAILDEKQELRKKKDKKKGDGSKQKIEVEIRSLEEKMAQMKIEMDHIIDDLDFPLGERLKLNTYIFSLDLHGPYERQAVLNYLKQKREEVAKNMWMVANILRSAEGVNPIMDEISDGWDRLLTKKRHSKEQDFRRLDASNDGVLVVKEEMVRFRGVATQAKDAVTDELIKIFDLEKPKMEREMNNFKMGEAKERLFITIQLYKTYPDDPQFRKFQIEEAKRTLHYLETKYQQVRSQQVEGYG